MGKRIAQQFTERLLKACHAVPGLDKLGKGETDQDYDWVKASQIFTAFRGELKKAAILILPNEISVESREVNSATGTVLHEVLLKKEFIVRDCRSAETMTFTAFGQAQDLADKALNKAKTACFKYFLRDLGIIPWLDVDDPEYDRSVDDVNTPAASKRRNSSAWTLSDRNIRAWASACRSGGKTIFQQAQWLAEQGVQSPEELSVEQFNKGLAWAYRNGELAETLSMSLPKKANGTEPQPSTETAGD